MYRTWTDEIVEAIAIIPDVSITGIRRSHLYVLGSSGKDQV
jgi:hypothetical protein